MQWPENFDVSEQLRPRAGMAIDQFAVACAVLRRRALAYGLSMLTIETRLLDSLKRGASQRQTARACGISRDALKHWLDEVRDKVSGME